MNKLTKEIANVLHSQIDNQTVEFHNTSLTSAQIDEIKKFADTFTRHGIPFPLKVR
jgi:hypothetical protein